ncbi:MAG: response regulator [Deltaproteobacteria bacterium]|nr:response regulator [Deltaproteobacteria bacterium]
MIPTPKILLVDDEDRFRTTMRKLLTGHGLDVTDVDSGHKALTALASQDFDVIVLDLRMPDMDGINTLKAMKDINPDLEVIILTGHASLDDAMEIMQLGGTEYLLKPCSVEALLDKIEIAFERKTIRETHGPQRRSEIPEPEERDQ